MANVAIGATVKASALPPVQEQLFPTVPKAGAPPWWGGAETPAAFPEPEALQPPKKATTTAFAILPTSSGPVLAPAGSVDGMLRADWALFLELAAYSLHGHMEGRIAFGIEEVAEAIKQAAVAVLFIPVSCGHGGESAVRGVAICGGRGYIVGSSHELYEDVDDWGAAAILHQPLARIKPASKEDSVEPPEKKPRIDGKNALLVGAVGKASALAPLPKAVEVTVQEDAMFGDADGPAPGSPDFPPQDEIMPKGDLNPPAQEKALRRELKVLGKAENLQDKDSIPRATESVRDRYLPQLGASTVFTAFADVFCRAKGVAHRKAMAYVVHELFMAKRGSAMRPEERRLTCIEKFLLRIGKVVKGFNSEERQAYVKLVGAWQTARVLMPAELTQVKDAWDMD